MSNARKVSTDALETLGTIITDREKRDAIHLAVIPMVAMEKLHAGEDIGLVDGGAAQTAREKLGIVDPFLKVPVQRGERFWMVLYPRMVTSLRHVWSHPAFADEGTNPAVIESTLSSSAKRVIESAADQAELSYEEMLAAAKRFAHSGDYMIEGGRWEGYCLPDGFWEAYELVSGEQVPVDDRGNIFSCSC